MCFAFKYFNRTWHQCSSRSWFFLCVRNLLFFFVDINDCLHHQCKNGGVCKDGINSYTCSCPQYHSGSKCEKSKLYIYLENRAFLGIFSGGTDYVRKRTSLWFTKKRKNGFLEKFCIFKPPGLDFLQYQHLKGALVPSVSMFKKALLGNCLISDTKIYLTICSFQTYISTLRPPLILHKRL